MKGMNASIGLSFFNIHQVKHTAITFCSIWLLTCCPIGFDSSTTFDIRFCITLDGLSMSKSNTPTSTESPSSSGLASNWSSMSTMLSSPNNESLLLISLTPDVYIIELALFYMAVFWFYIRLTVSNLSKDVSRFLDLSNLMIGASHRHWRAGDKWFWSFHCHCFTNIHWQSLEL